LRAEKKKEKKRNLPGKEEACNEEDDKEEAERETEGEGERGDAETSMEDV
jgi:hypothetical protein